MPRERVVKVNDVYTSIIHRGRMYDDETFKKVVLEILDSKFKHIFRTKQLADEVLAKQLNCNLRAIFFDDRLADLRTKLSYKLAQLMVSFQKEGIVEKYSNLKSNHFWRKL